MPLSLAEVESAAKAVARREEEFIYLRQTDFGLQGLLNATGHNQASHGDWSNLDSALNDVLAAVTTLDEAGFHGPYALALPPLQYNCLTDDAALADRVTTQLYWHRATHGMKAEVFARDGTVTLRGQAADPQQAELARLIALNTCGVKRADNQLQTQAQD